jgi:hypothetical protein
MRNWRPTDLDSLLSRKRSRQNITIEPTQVSKEIIDRFNSLAKRIEDLPESARFAVAVAVTQGLMDQYLLEPENRRSSFVAPWAEMTPLLWAALTHPSAELKRTLETKLKEFIEECFDRESPEYGQPRYAADAGYACISAIEAYCGNSKAAAGPVSDLLAHAQRRAQRTSTKMGEDLMSANARARVLRLRHMELDRVENAVSLLEREGFSVGVLTQLRELLTSEGTPG